MLLQSLVDSFVSRQVRRDVGYVVASNVIQSKTFHLKFGFRTWIKMRADQNDIFTGRN